MSFFKRMVDAVTGRSVRSTYPEAKVQPIAPKPDMTRRERERRRKSEARRQHRKRSMGPKRRVRTLERYRDRKVQGRALLREL